MSVSKLGGRAAVVLPSSPSSSVVLLLNKSECNNTAIIPNPTLNVTHPNTAHFCPPNISNMMPLSKKRNVTNILSEFITLAISNHWAAQHDDVVDDDVDVNTSSSSKAKSSS